MYRGFAEYAPFDMESKGFTEINIGELLVGSIHSRSLRFVRTHVICSLYMCRLRSGTVSYSE